MLYQKKIILLFRHTGDFIWCILIIHVWEAVKNSSCLLLNISLNLNVSLSSLPKLEVHGWLRLCLESIPYFMSFLVIILGLESCQTELLNFAKGTFHFIIVPSCCPEPLTCFYDIEKNWNHPPTLLSHELPSFHGHSDQHQSPCFPISGELSIYSQLLCLAF